MGEWLGVSRGSPFTTCTPVSTGTPLWESPHPICRRVACGAVFPDVVSPRWHLSFVGQEWSLVPTPITFEQESRHPFATSIVRVSILSQEDQRSAGMAVRFQQKTVGPMGFQDSGKTTRSPRRETLRGKGSVGGQRVYTRNRRKVKKLIPAQMLPHERVAITHQQLFAEAPEGSPRTGKCQAIDLCE